MSESVWVVLIGTVFRALCLLAGLGFAYLGYRLFVKGVLEKEETIRLQWKRVGVLLKNVAPGVVFATFGLFVAALGVLRPISIHAEVHPSVSQKPISQKQEPVEPAATLITSDAVLAKLTEGAKLHQGVQLTAADTQHLLASIDNMNSQIETDKLNEQVNCLLSKDFHVDMKYEYEPTEAKKWWEFWKW
jgi:hypothetical protein